MDKKQNTSNSEAIEEPMDIEDTSDLEKSSEQTEPSDKSVHVAFAGGGWRAHTGHSAWLISLLQNGTLSLDDAFKNVGTIGSNSGGSWFNTMLAFSDTFVSDIQAKNAIVEWGDTGWLGIQQSLFHSVTDCNHDDDYWYAYTLCALDELDNESRNWTSIVKEIVYKGYPIDSIPLNGKRVSWASDKTLLLAGSMLTSNVLLNKYGKNDFGHRDEYQYYITCHSPATLDMSDIGLVASCTYPRGDDTKYHEVSPVIFTGLPAGSNDMAPPVLASLKSGEYFNAGYSEDIADPNRAETQIENPTNNNQVSALHAATASSAALGFLSYVVGDHLLWTWGDAYDSRNLAPSFSLNNGISISDVTKLTASELSDQKMVRIADGGPVDNSGVAQVVKYLQMNNSSSDSFNIVAFDNVSSGFLAKDGKKTAKTQVGVDIANLFGKGLCDDDSKYCFVGCSDLKQLAGCIVTPETKIFELDPLMTTDKTWHFSEGGKELIYTQYKVTTVANPNYGIAANSHGTVHAFTCVAPGVEMVPTSSELDGYYDMLNFIYLGITKSPDGEGLTHLKNAFKI